MQQSEQQLAKVRELDQKDPLAGYRNAFHIPQVDGKDAIYLCGNSLGLQPKKAKDYVLDELDDWASFGVKGHLHARHPWLPYHEFLTEHMAEVVGGKPDEVVVMNSLTVNLHLLMVSFYRPTGKRYKILVESDIFPSDLYAVESQIRFHGFDPKEALIKWHPREGEHTLRMEDLHEILDKEGDAIALIMLGGVNYYTGQVFDMQEITRLGHDRGITVGIDLAHGAGNIELSLHDWDVDFACWCSYKYLNSGPGGLSGIFVHERYARAFELPRFAGWWGHNKETRFGMRDPFDPLPGAEGWQLSNPPILPMATLRASLEIFHEAGMHALRVKSKQLTGLLEEFLLTSNIPGLEIITPSDPEQRGCQLSLSLHGGGKSIFDKITTAGVIADWREPNVIRIAPVPLYNSFEDVGRFVVELEKALG